MAERNEETNAGPGDLGQHLVPTSVCLYVEHHSPAVFAVFLLTTKALLRLVPLEVLSRFYRRGAAVKGKCNGAEALRPESSPAQH